MRGALDQARVDRAALLRLQGLLGRLSGRVLLLSLHYNILRIIRIFRNLLSDSVLILFLESGHVVRGELVNEGAEAASDGLLLGEALLRRWSSS